MKIILGSKSKGRKMMMEEMGIDFEVMVADIDEKAIRLEDPKELVLAIARAKSEALIPRIAESAILITSDQVVVWNGLIREKPENEIEAREFLEGYNDFPAENVTSVVVVNLENGKRVEDVDVAKVYFNNFSKEDIDELISDGEVFHLAGGFNCDGDKWRKYIKNIEGAKDSVIGLPKDVTRRLIQAVCEE